MEEAEPGSPSFRSRRSSASVDTQEGRAEASEDSPAPTGGGGRPPEEAHPARERSWWSWWSKDQKSLASDQKYSAGNSTGPSPAKHLEQEEPGSRNDLKAGIATRWMKLESELQVLRNSTHPLALEFLQTLERSIQITAQLLTENQQLRHQQQSSQEDQVPRLLAENQRLQQELQALRSGQRAPVPQRAPHISTSWMPIPWNTAFPVQLLITGQTKGCEKCFMGDVARLLAGQRISLQVEDYQKDSKQFLLLFCPVASRPGTDIQNALEGLSSTRKTLLVVCHYKPKGSAQSFVSRGQEVRHPAVVMTVHACYTLQDGFYHCQRNTEAVEAVAAAIASELRGD